MIDLLSLPLKWSEPKTVETRSGWKTIRNAEPTREFHAIYQKQKLELRAAGLSFSRTYNPETGIYDGSWQVTWWGDPPPEKTEQAIKEAIDASQAVDSDFVVPLPKGRELRPYQRAGVKFCVTMLERYGGVLNADVMGLGKSCQTIGVLNVREDIKKVIIVCPRSLKVNWMRELMMFCTREFRVKIVGSQDACLGQSLLERHDLLIINPEILKRFSSKEMPVTADLIVADECHVFKNRKSQRNAALRTIKSKYRIGLTGTPILNRVGELAEIINWLQPKEFSNKGKLLKKYCGAVMGVVSSDSVDSRLQARLRSTVMIRRLKQDVAKEIPEKQYQVLELPCEGRAAEICAEEMQNWKSAEQKRAELKVRVELARCSEDQSVFVDAVQSLRDSNAASFEKMAELRKLAEEATLELSIPLIEDQLGTQKIVTFGHHRHCIEKMFHHFKGRSVIHYGGMKEDVGQKSVDDFQNLDRIQVFSGSILASGVGLTLTASSWVFFYGWDWRPGMMAQCVDRLHRIGQKSTVLAQFAVLEGSVAAYMAKVNVEKLEMIDRALDKDRENLLKDDGYATIEKIKPVSVRRKELEKIAASLTDAQVLEIHRKIIKLASVCDGARRLDHLGFNAVDSKIGQELAKQPGLSKLQAGLASLIVSKYEKQLKLI